MAPAGAAGGMLPRAYRDGTRGRFPLFMQVKGRLIECGGLPARGCPRARGSCWDRNSTGPTALAAEVLIRCRFRDMHP